MTGRPKDSEAAPYYFTYINRITGDDVVVSIGDQLEETMALCSTISEKTSLHRYAAGKWSVRQVEISS
jgi:hypothetical protein